MGITDLAVWQEMPNVRKGDGLMKFVYKLERKLGRYAIKNVALVLIICYAIGYILELMPGNWMSFLSLNPYLVLHGQVWRLITWILVPPESFSFFTLIMLYFYYSLGTTLERTWGSFRFNFFIFGGILFTIIGAFAAMGYCYLTDAEFISAVGAEQYFTRVGGYAIGNKTYWLAGTWFDMISTYYVNMSIFLAFAATYPDMQIYLMFILPIKIKYMGIIYAALLIYEMLHLSAVGRIIVVASILNFIVFFLLTRNYKRISPAEYKRKQNFRREVRQGMRGDNTVAFRGRTAITRHRCAVCGRTELDDDSLEFRFCSKCDGNYEYCMEHLYTHEHVHKQTQEEELPH